MSAITQLLLVTDEYERATQLDRVTVSWRIFGDSKKLGALHAGKDIQVKRLEAALQWLSDHWPEAAEWPPLVPCPRPRDADGHTGERGAAA